MDTNAIYVLWLRDVKRFFRARSRVVGMLIMPVFFMVGLGFGFNSLIHLGSGSYIEFMVPGIIGMSLLFTAVSSGVSILWDKQFGFLKEILVTPNSRVAVAIGRVAGGATTAVLQGVLVVFIALLIGFTIHVSAIALLSIIFMLLTAATFIGLGLAFGAIIEDFQGFQLITSLVTFPLFFLSGSIFPISALPESLQYVSYANPLTYGIDGLRGTLMGSSSFPLALDFAVMLLSAVAMVLLASYAFTRIEVS